VVVIAARIHFGVHTIACKPSGCRFIKEQISRCAEIPVKVLFAGQIGAQGVRPDPQLLNVPKA